MYYHSEYFDNLDNQSTYQNYLSKIKVLITVPVLNEEYDLEKNIKILADFSTKNFNYEWEIEIADNGSSDKTPEIGQKLANENNRIKYLRLEKRGRGLALKESWQKSNADILSYMDVDLSANIEAFPKLIEEIMKGADIAIGSRLSKFSRTKRQPKREIISRGYNLLIKLLFQNKFSDAQCGFKMIKREVAKALLPKIKDDSWFFNTELLFLAERCGYKISEVPVEWIEDLDSRVNILKTAIEDIKGLVRIKFGKS